MLDKTMTKSELTAQIIETFEKLNAENRACMILAVSLLHALEKNQTNPEPVEKRLLDLTRTIQEKLETGANDPRISQDARANALRMARIYGRTHEALKAMRGDAL